MSHRDSSVQAEPTGARGQPLYHGGQFDGGFVEERVVGASAVGRRQALWLARQDGPAQEQVAEPQVQQRDAALQPSGPRARLGRRRRGVRHAADAVALVRRGADRERQGDGRTWGCSREATLARTERTIAAARRGPTVAEITFQVVQ